ncbi:MAG: hypothetical protein ACE5LH_03520 [Fidelibacterota bacterium]
MALEGIICPECKVPLDDSQLQESLVCPNCKTDLKTPKYLDFIEYLVANGIVSDIDFFDTELYSDEIERLDPSDQEEIDPQDYEKRKESFSLFEDDVEPVEEEETEDMDIWEGLEEDWEEFNRRDAEDETSEK